MQEGRRNNCSLIGGMIERKRQEKKEKMQSKNRKTRKAINECKNPKQTIREKLIQERRQDVSASDNQFSMLIKEGLGKERQKWGEGGFRKLKANIRLAVAESG